MIVELYTDGGVAIKNPSPFGLSWAFCVVHGGTDTLIHHDAGRVHLSQLEKLGKYRATNNLAEMIAAVKGFEYVKEHYPENLCRWFPDSQFTYNRVFNSYSTALLPKILVDRLHKSRTYLITGTMVASHPTKKELARGFREKDGKTTLVSEWNVFVDKLCKEQSKLLLLNKGD